MSVANLPHFWATTRSMNLVLRWVQRYVPDFEKRWTQYARSVGDSWRCDETYIKR
jgi:transposase-like protein